MSCKVCFGPRKGVVVDMELVPNRELRTAPTRWVSPTTSSPSKMLPPRPPLQPRANTNGTLCHSLVGAAPGMKGPITSSAVTKSSTAKAKATPKPLSKEDLDEFKDAIVGSQSSKVDLMKGLKLRSVLRTFRSTYPVC